MSLSEQHAPDLGAHTHPSLVDMDSNDDSASRSKRGGRTANSRNWQQNELQELVFARLEYEKHGAQLRQAAPSLKDPADLVHWHWEQRLKHSRIPQIRDVKPEVLDKKFREIWKAYERITGRGEDIDLSSIGKDIPMSSKKCAWQLRDQLSELSRFVGKSIRLSASLRPDVPPFETEPISSVPSSNMLMTPSSDMNSTYPSEPTTKRARLMSESVEPTVVNGQLDSIVKEVRTLKAAQDHLSSLVDSLNEQYQHLVTVINENFQTMHNQVQQAAAAVAHQNHQQGPPHQAPHEPQHDTQHEAQHETSHPPQSHHDTPASESLPAPSIPSGDAVQQHQS